MSNDNETDANAGSQGAVPPFTQWFAAARRLRAGHRLLTRERFAEAAACYERAAEACPVLPQPWLHLAAARVQMNDAAGAVEAAREAQRLGPAESAAHLLAGVVCLDAGEPDEADAAFARAAELNPDNELARAYPLLLRWQRGDARGALAALKPSRMPESSDFLARLLLLVEDEMRRIEANPKSSAPPMTSPAAEPERGATPTPQAGDNQ